MFQTPAIIEVNPKILGGQPVVRGTRVPIARLVALIVQGYKLPDFKKDYPYIRITNNDLLEIFGYYRNQVAQ